jgi:hypothetical protein
MNLDSETTKEINLLSPLMDMINSVLSLNYNKTLKSKNFSEEPSIFSQESDINFCFKVLILDNSTFKFLSPLLKQSNLKKNNICLITKLDAQKDVMPSVMSIYLVTPSPTNFSLILKDMKNNIYQNYSINFIEKPDDNLLEEFLTNIIKLDIYQKIYNLHVLPIKYSLIHPKILDFCSSDSKIVKPYSIFNLNLNDKTTENYYYLISNMLFNALFCMKISPLVKYRSGSFSNKIATKIENKFISTFNKFPELKEEFKNGNCLLVILERDLLDLPIMLHHPSGFGAIINDICGITFDQDTNNNKNEIKKFCLDPLNDFIWNKSITKLYHEVGDETLLKYKKYIQQMEIFSIDKKPNNLEDLENKSEKLAQSIKDLDVKRLEGDILDKHAKIYPILNKNIETRHLAQIYSIEKNILDRREINNEINNSINEFIKDGKINNENHLDVFRLCLIYILVDKDSANDKFIKDIIQTLKIPAKYNVKIILDYLDMIKKGTKSHSSLDLINKFNSENSQSQTMLGQVGGVTKKLFKKGFNFLKNAVNNFRGRNSPALAMDVLYDLIKETKKQKEIFDESRINKKIYVPDNSSKKTIFLFILGGGSLNEYEYCKEFVESYGYNFIYGADKIYSPNEFLDEINDLAINEMKDI